MMVNLFTVFDPLTKFSFSLNWFSMILAYILLPMSFWIKMSRFYMSWSFLLLYIFKEFKVLIEYSYSNLIIFLSLFLIIFFNNFLGLFPYIFTASSHMSFCLSLSLTLWLGIIIYSMLNYFNDFCMHLTPQGTPIMLMSFMVMIETVSLIIRPLTLSIRLTANMIAGHLLMVLLGSVGSNLSILLSLLILTQILLIILEMCVSVIQAYVFSVLSTLYSSEI